jgi:SAM-dependent methyltransferase
MRLSTYRLRDLCNRYGKIWLNVGGGSYFLDDFVNVDSNFLFFLAPFYPVLRPLLKGPAREWIEAFKAGRKPHNFIFADCRVALDFPEASIDHILISHFLEHLHYDDAVSVLRNYLLILKPGGTLHIIVPDLAEKAREYVSNIGDPKATEAFVDWTNFRRRKMRPLPVRILQVTGWFNLGHCYLYDLPLLSKLVRDVGFEILTDDNTPSASWRRNDPWQVNIAVKKPAENEKAQSEVLA